MLMERQKERRANKLRALPLFDKIVSEKSPSIAQLEKLISINERKSEPVLTTHDTKALRLKYRAMTTTPTTIEKTMSIEQLCKSNNSLWAKDIPIQNLVFYFAHKEHGASNIEAMHRCQMKFRVTPPTISIVQQRIKQLLNNHDNIQ